MTLSSVEVIVVIMAMHAPGASTVGSGRSCDVGLYSRRRIPAPLVGVSQQSLIIFSCINGVEKDKLLVFAEVSRSVRN